MYKSVSFFLNRRKLDGTTYTFAGNTTYDGGRNSWASWRLIPSSRPYISPPVQKTNYVEVPFSDSQLDFSEFGVDDPVFENRQGSIEFTAVNKNVYGYEEGKKRANDGNLVRFEAMEDGKDNILDWDRTYSDLMDFMQGERRLIVLEDDPSYYYEGRVEIESTSPDEQLTKYTVNYNVEPYKKVRFTPGGDMNKLPWDSIDFEANLDILGLKDIEIKRLDTFHLMIPKTLRKKVYPRITIKCSDTNKTGAVAMVSIRKQNNPNEYRTVYLAIGTNKAKSYRGIDSTIEDLYFSGMTSNVYMRIANLTTSKLTVTIDYQLEGF